LGIRSARILTTFPRGFSNSEGVPAVNWRGWGADG
jgi:hypothetical protein